MIDSRKAKVERALLWAASHFALTLCVAAFFFLWALPQIGHQYYKMINYRFTHQQMDISHVMDCIEDTYLVNEGYFLGVYPYRAILSKGCITHTRKNKNEIYTMIEVRPPYTFLSKIKEKVIEFVSGEYEMVYREVKIIAINKENTDE